MNKNGYELVIVRQMRESVSTALNGIKMLANSASDLSADQWTDLQEAERNLRNARRLLLIVVIALETGEDRETE